MSSLLISKRSKFLSFFSLYMDALPFLITGISIPLLLFTVFGNFLVFVVINKNKKLQNANTCLISNLAWSDFGFGIVTFVDIIFLSNSVPHSSFQFVANALASIYFLVSLAVERYFAILKPFVHMKRASKSLMWKVTLAIWILVGILSAGGYFVNSMSWQYCCQNATMNATRSLQLANVTTGASAWLGIFSTIYVFVLLVFGLVLPSAVIIFCYSRVIYHVWFNIEDRATNHALFKSRRKLTKLFIILTITFLFTWTPTFGRPIVTRFGNGENATKYQLVSMLLALLGSAANPVIYSFRCPRFRQEVVVLLTCCCCKRKRLQNGRNVFVTNSFSLKKTKKERSVIEPVSISFPA